MNKQSGFTLIELVMVIVILGILAAVAVPNFIDLRAEAQQAAVEGVAGALASGSAMNFGACAAGSPACVAVTNCNVTNGLLVSGLPAGYSLNNLFIPVGSPVTCQLTGPAPSVPVNFVAIGT